MTLAVIALAALLLVACGQEDEDGALEQGSPSSSVTPTERDERIAAAGTLQVADIGGDWRLGPRRPFERSSCESLNEVRTSARHAELSRALIGKPSGSRVLNVVYVFDDVQSAEDGFSKIAAEGTQRCVARDAASEVKDVSRRYNAQVIGMSDRKLAIQPVGAESAAFEFRINIAAGGEHATVYAHRFISRVDRVLIVLASQLLVNNEKQLRALLDRIADRVQHAVKSS